jgi:hypothetical protein
MVSQHLRSTNCCNDIYFCLDHALRQWSIRYLESMAGLKDLRVPLRLQNLMREAGFVDVESRMIQLPTCAWSTGQSVHLRNPVQ